MNNSTIKQAARALGMTGALLVLGSGCVSTAGGPAYQEANQREDYALVQERMRRLEGDLESLTMQMDQVRQDLQRIQAAGAHAADARVSGLRAGLDGVEGRIDRLEAQAEADRREIVQTVSQEVARLVNESAAARRPERSSTPSGYGYEHIVQPGETLSRIAQAYGTTMSAIQAANNLQNPDALKVGQRLIIPE